MSNAVVNNHFFHQNPYIRPLTQKEAPLFKTWV